MTDYISREMTIDAICRLCNANFEEDPCEQSECEMMSLLRKIPAADVRPVVKARWIHMPSDGKFRDTCVCSACKKSPPIESWIVQGFNACPYCFADMREEN